MTVVYQVLYRKWRPQRFDDVSGQEHIVATLKKEVAENRLNHAYLFTGSRGTGKTTCAKILSKAVNCLDPQNGNPCGKCEICRDIENGSVTDIVEMDAASNRKIDNIRDIIEEVQFKPARCKYRVYIIDEVHMLTTEAFNALLKTLEEPPSHVLFILATTEVHKLPQTILSRCQRFDFHRIPPRDIADRLLYVAGQEGVALHDNAALLAASVADGALRDALSLLDRCIAISSDIDEEVVRNAAGLADKEYLYELAACTINKNTAKSLEIIDRLYSESKDMSRLCDELIAHFRALMLIKSVRDPRDILVMSESELEKAQTQADYLSLADIVYYMDVLSRAYGRMGHGTGDRTELEMAMVKLSAPELDATSEAMAARVTALEKAIKNVSALSAAQTAVPRETSYIPEEKAEHKAENVKPAPQTLDEKPTQNELPQKDFSGSDPENTSSEAEKSVHSSTPAPEPQIAVKRQTAVNLDEIYRNAKPFPQWVEVVNNLKPISRTISAAFTGSSAYESGDYLLIDASTDIAFELLKNSSRRDEIRRTIRETTGRVFKLGPYKKPAETREVEDKLSVFKNLVKASGIEYTEE
ncbi:MAG: DNA polymerase III subunit gamma/tau [Ruminococcus sp.]|nr:DNA polymerase III subunit gamma/tau [Ruminococcus sp.]